MRGIPVSVLLIGVYCSFTHGRSIAPLSDPEEWRNSILWNEKKPVSLGFKYESADGSLQTGEVSGGLTLGYSEDRMPSAAVAFTNKLKNVLDGDWLSALKIAAELHHNELQGVVVANKTELNYLLNLKLDQGESSLGGLIQGSKATLTNGGLTAGIAGMLTSIMVNQNVDNVKDITINL